MKITIEINTDNAAFQDGYLNTEVSRILLVLGDPDNDFTFPRRCHIWDINGNPVGYIKVSDSD